MIPGLTRKQEMLLNSLSRLPGCKLDAGAGGGSMDFSESNPRVWGPSHYSVGHAGYTSEFNDPNVFTGYITKRGHMVRNWKRRFFYISGKYTSPCRFSSTFHIRDFFSFRRESQALLLL